MFSSILDQLLLFLKTSTVVKEAAALLILGLLASPGIGFLLWVLCLGVRYVRRKYLWGE